MPFTVAAALRPSWLALSLKSLDLLTSDELGLALTGLVRSWSLHPLTWADPGGPSLLEFRITHVGDQWVPARRERKRRDERCEAEVASLDVLDSDPIELGLRLAREGPPAIQLAAQDDVGDDALFEDMPEEFAADIADAFAEFLGVVDAEVANSLGVHAVAEAVADSDSSDADVEQEIVAVDPPDIAEEIVSDSHLQPWEVAEVSDTGYVTCPLPPWCDLPCLGRITTWPAAAPRNISCKCYIHIGWTSPARRSNVITREHLLRWLFSGTCEPLCPRARSEELGAAHKHLFATAVVACDAARAPALVIVRSSASSSGARSSTDPEHNEVVYGLGPA